jgi:uncharacterized membrane protein YgdD (TMEM256/DUF423 family)
MCPLRTPFNIALIVSFFALLIIIDIAKRFVKEPAALKALRILDTVLYVGMLLFVGTLFLRSFF